MRPTLGVVCKGFAVAAVFVAASAPTVAQEPTSSAIYRTLDGRREFSFEIKGKGTFTRPVGMMNWDVPVTSLTAPGLERLFRTFCAEPLIPVYPGRMYSFIVDPLDAPKSFGLADDEKNKEIAARKAKYLRELFARHYGTAAGSFGEEPAAFQTAIWEIMGEEELPDGPSPFNLFTGSFRANYPSEAESPPFVQLSQRYLQSLTGDDAVFANSPAYAAMELVRLTSVAGADGLLGQSQLALRVAPGAGVGDSVAAGGAAPLVGGGGLLSGPGGGPLVGGGGFGAPTGISGGAFTGGIGGFGGITGFGGSGGQNPGTRQPIVTPPGSGSGGGGGGPNAVPAPAGLVLVSVGALAAAISRRVMRSRPAA